MTYDRLHKPGISGITKGFAGSLKVLGASSRKYYLPGVKEPVEISQTLNRIWSMDFVTDVLENKGRFRAFTIINDFNMEATSKNKLVSI